MEEHAGGGSLILLLIWAVVVVVPFWKISEKAGFSGWLSLLILVPLVNIGYLYYLGFARWPNR
jgi:hypothetical protein